jgi:hypothetical protein
MKGAKKTISAAQVLKIKRRWLKGLYTQSLDSFSVA